MKAVLLASCLTLALLPMCKPDTAKTTTEAAAVNPASPTEVRAQFDILRDSTEQRWRRMMASDDRKLADIRALLDQLKKRPRLDAGQVRQLSQATARIRPQRYDRWSMASAELSDRYDAMQDSVLRPLYRLAAPEGNAPTAQIRDYIEHIMKADADVVNYRANYDAAAKVYNAYLQVHQAELAKMGGKYAHLRPLPLFELGQ